MHFSTLRTLASLVILSSSALAHMEMIWPYALRSKYNPNTPADLIDYSNTSPLNSDGSNFPCKGYNKDTPTAPVATYVAGSTYNMTLAGTAMHGGGSCQLSLSYDNGTTWKVIKSMEGGCPLTTTYDFTIPYYAPSGTVLFAWSWFNLIGNPEMYMNCAVVNVQGTSASRVKRHLKRQVAESMSDLPEMFVANVGNNCSTSDSNGRVVIFAEPGDDVIYGSGADSTSPVYPSTCASAEAVATDSPIPSSTISSTPASTTSTIPTGTNTPIRFGSARFLFVNATANANPTGSIPLNTGVVLSTGSSSSILSTGVSSSSTTSSTFSSSSSSSTSSSSSSTSSLSSSSHSSSSSPIPTSSSSSTSSSRSSTSSTFSTITRSSTSSQGVVTVTVPSTLTIYPSTSTTSASSTSTSSAPASSSTITLSGPCTPGHIYCTSNTTFSMCSGQGDSYIAMGNVAAGMACIDNAYVRARPFGSCSTNGAIQCTDNGASYLVCDQGGWIDMGAVSAGTTCTNGAIVAS